MELKIREFRKNLANHLASGETITLLKRNTPIAIITNLQNKSINNNNLNNNPTFTTSSSAVKKAEPSTARIRIKKTPAKPHLSFLCKHGRPRSLCEHKGNKLLCEL
jgi:antitoxin (DNA-binding transcriptional repressor) of toxin-antitoxin stability system